MGDGNCSQLGLAAITMDSNVNLESCQNEVPGVEGRYPDEGIRSMCAHIGINQLLHGDGIAIEIFMSKIVS